MFLKTDGESMSAITLGKGSFGTVHEIIDKSNQEKFALKVPEHRDSFYLESIKKEFVILHFLIQKQNFSSSHIIRPFGIRRTQDANIGLILELLGFDLKKYSTKHPDKLSLEKISHFTWQIAKGLTFLAEHEVIHGDIKPQNILVSSCGESIKLCDFGISSFTKKTKEHTTDFCYVQTPAYRSPEVILRIQPTPSIDVWSLGAVIAELYTKELTFITSEPTEEHLIANHIISLNENYPNTLIEQGSIFGQETFQRAKVVEFKERPKVLIQAIEKKAKENDDCLEKIESLKLLLSQIFTYDPKLRITAKNIQTSPFAIKITPSTSSASTTPTSTTPPLASTSSSATKIVPPTLTLLKSGSFKKIYLVSHGTKSQVWKISLTKRAETSVIHEATMLLSLRNHPHIIQTKGIIPLKIDSIGLVLEPLKTSLEEYLSQNSLTLNKIKRFTYQIAKALMHLNENTIIHRNINTSCILIDKSGDHIKIANFSLAIFTFEAPENIRTSKILGDIENKSPEALLEIPLTTQNDVWAFATVIAKLCTTKILFPVSKEDEDIDQALIYRHIETLGFPYDPDLISQISSKG